MYMVDVLGNCRATMHRRVLAQEKRLCSLGCNMCNMACVEDSVLAQYPPLLLQAVLRSQGRWRCDLAQGRWCCGLAQGCVYCSLAHGPWYRGLAHGPWYWGLAHWFCGLARARWRMAPSARSRVLGPKEPEHGRA